MTFQVEPLPVVIDASEAVEIIEGGQDVGDRLSRWAASRRLILVPALFWTELANALLWGRGMPPDAVRTRMSVMRTAGIETLTPSPTRIDAAVWLAARHRLSVYDASYLQGAVEIDASLATRDVALARAAEAEGVALEPLD